MSIAFQQLESWICFKLLFFVLVPDCTISLHIVQKCKVSRMANPDWTIQRNSIHSRWIASSKDWSGQTVWQTRPVTVRPTRNKLAENIPSHTLPETDSSPLKLGPNCGKGKGSSPFTTIFHGPAVSFYWVTNPKNYGLMVQDQGIIPKIEADFRKEAVGDQSRGDEREVRIQPILHVNGTSTRSLGKDCNGKRTIWRYIPPWN